MRAVGNPHVLEMLGEPVEEPWFVGGQLSSSKANIAIPLTGPKGKGVLYVHGEKAGGSWQYSKIEFLGRQSSDRIDLLE